MKEPAGILGPSSWIPFHPGVRLSVLSRPVHPRERLGQQFILSLRHFEVDAVKSEGRRLCLSAFFFLFSSILLFL